jgi:hypothetical protein
MFGKDLVVIATGSGNIFRRDVESSNMLSDVVDDENRRLPDGILD